MQEQEGNPSAISHVMVTVDAAIQKAVQAEGVTPLDIWLGLIQYTAQAGINNGLDVDQIAMNAEAFASAAAEASHRGVN